MKRSICLAFAALLLTGTDVFAADGSLEPRTSDSSIQPAKRLVVNNPNDYPVACAVVHFAQGRWHTEHWYRIDPGKERTFVNPYYAYCEKTGGGGWWGSREEGDFCVSAGEGPVFRSNMRDVCLDPDRVDRGVMLPRFARVSGDTVRWNLQQ
ncbi:Protein of unknown function [Nannocystis exedens]|uniref:DUF1036 domain-containing protein n=1 Tax=Nannocystis exedens TaxID=54 RepID=A0A1I2DAQ0_9BACT|nr:DUF1036 domain-containing protein [Nannocystis exedens]PCC70622.1 hypothetical protein NAEX_03686 [Nannocystis exedens]SFE77559.1 Protein of unknown function [Nannocystis exedens]